MGTILRTLMSLLMICLVSLMMPSEARAEFSGQIRFASNYVYRGYSKSSGQPVFQGNLEYGHASGFYGGAWASKVDFGDQAFDEHTHIEVNPYVGWNVGLAEDWRLDTTLFRYIFESEGVGSSADYNELNAALHFRDLFTARFAVAMDAYGRGTEIFDYELQARYPLMDVLELSGSVGYEDADRVLEYDYTYWNLGATWFFHRNAAIDLHYHDAHLSDERLPGPGSMHLFELPEIENHVVVSVSVGF
jgi:uncharacterized protein (TIGR02001 family)